MIYCFNTDLEERKCDKKLCVLTDEQYHQIIKDVACVKPIKNRMPITRIFKKYVFKSKQIYPAS